MDLVESHRCKHRFHDNDRFYCWHGNRDVVVLCFRRDQLVPTGDCAFAAIIAGGRRAFPFFTAIRGFLCEFLPTKAVKGFEKQENCYQADRNVDAATHSYYKISKISIRGGIARKDGFGSAHRMWTLSTNPVRRKQAAVTHFCLTAFDPNQTNNRLTLELTPECILIMERKR